MSAVTADASVDAQVAQIMNYVNFDDIEASIKADLMKELENTAIKNQIKKEVEKKVTELKTKEDATWQDWTMLRMYEATQWEQYEKMLNK